jgi:hypothetical protein
LNPSLDVCMTTSLTCPRHKYACVMSSSSRLDRRADLAGRPSCDVNPTISMTPCILQGEYIPGEKNVGADRLSLPTLAPTWASVIVDCPEVKLCWRHQVPPRLLLALALTISSGSIEANVAKEMIALWTCTLLTSRTG